VVRPTAAAQIDALGQITHHCLDKSNANVRSTSAGRRCCGRSKLTDSLTEQRIETMADFRHWPASHAGNCVKLGRLERALWRVADWPVVGAATKELEKRGVVLGHRTPEAVRTSPISRDMVSSIRRR
jgi:hypothetical protein